LSRSKSVEKKPKRPILETLGSYTEIQLEELYKKSKKLTSGLEKISDKLANSNTVEERKTLNKIRELKIRDLQDSSK